MNNNVKDKEQCIAPRLTQAIIDSKIKDIYFDVLSDGTTTVCTILLENRFKVNGMAHCVSKENYNKELGEEMSLKEAKRDIWKYEGYLLTQRIYEIENAL